jgi:hypothetical protein
VQSSFAATDRIVAHGLGCSGARSNTIRTARAFVIGSTQQPAKLDTCTQNRSVARQELILIDICSGDRWRFLHDRTPYEADRTGTRTHARQAPAMPTLLRYALTTSLFPLQTSPESGDPVVSTLTIVASNAHPSPNTNTVQLQGLIVTVPVGSNGADLTEDAQAIAPVAPAGWRLQGTQYPSGSASFIFVPQGGSAQVGGTSLVFTLTSVAMNRQTGTVEVNVTEGSGGCQAPNCPVQPLYVTKFPNGWGAVSYTATPNPPIVPPGSGPTLRWSGPAGATYTIDYYLPDSGIVTVPAQGSPPLSNEGVYPAHGDPPLQLTQTTTFYLSVTDTIDGVPYQDQKQIDVTVTTPAPAITRFSSAVAPGADGYEVTFYWASENAASCALSCYPAELTKNSPSTGLMVPQPQLAARYTLTAFGDDGRTASSTILAQWTPVRRVAAVSGGGAIAITPDGSRAYVLTRTSIQIYGIDTDGSLTPGGAIRLDAAGVPINLVLSPDGGRLYLLTGASESPATWRLRALTSTGQAIGPAYELPPGPTGLAVSPDGARLYVQSGLSQIISAFVVSPSTSDPLQPIGETSLDAYGDAGSPSAGLVVSPDGTTLYAGGYDCVFALRTSPDTSVPLVLLQTATVSRNARNEVAGLAAAAQLPFVAALLQPTDTSGTSTLLLLDPDTLAPLVPRVALVTRTTSVFAGGLAMSGSLLYVLLADGITLCAPTALFGGTGN